MSFAGLSGRSLIATMCFSSLSSTIRMCLSGSLLICATNLASASGLLPTCTVANNLFISGYGTAEDLGGAVRLSSNAVTYSGVINLSGNLYLRAGRSAFTEIEVALADLGSVEHILVDMHAEATSEKVAMGWHLDGRVTAVVGTHTHVPTADARLLNHGTAYITDVGMTGPRGGVIGVKREQALEGLLTQMPVRFETSDVDPWLMGVLIRCSQPLRAESIEQILMPRPNSSQAG